jgi:hypothetical protein
MNQVVKRTTAHLAVVFGAVEAERLVEECLREAGLEEANEADQLYRLGTAFLSKGGFLEVVGRFLRVQAISIECPGVPGN